MRKVVIILLLLAGQVCSAQDVPHLQIIWNKILAIYKTTPTLQVVGNPMLLKSSPIHDASFDALHNLGAEYVRYCPWFPHPKLAVAELAPPDNKKTHWDFSYMDPLVLDFLKATDGDSSILDFSTIPQWMFKTEKPVTYPEDPTKIAWSYGGGTELRDTTRKELAGYFSRLISWYSKGGFTDELGKYHRSGYHFNIPYWEVLNEPVSEHSHTVEQYTKRYDAIVSAVKKASPQTKFVGMALAEYWDPKWFEYFLNPANHKPGIPLDMISYHFYASCNLSQKFEDYQYCYFDKADQFLSNVVFIENIRKRLSPNTKTNLDELGTMVNWGMVNDIPKGHPLPAEYWNLSASVYAYLFIKLSQIGIDIMGSSALVCYPGNYPDVTMIDWNNGKPNARYWGLKLLIDNFSPGDTLVETNNGSFTDDYSAQGFISAKKIKKVLFLNKRDKVLTIKVPGEFKGAKLSIVDTSTGEGEPATTVINSDMLELKPFAVVVATLNHE